MTGDNDDVFDGVPEAPQTTEGVSPEAPSERPRDEQGRFAPQDKGDLAPTGADGAPPAPAQHVDRTVPLSALLDERDKRRQYEAELAHYRAQQQQPPQLPDPVEDVQGYTYALQSQFEQRMQAAAIRQSRVLAEREFGRDAVEEAIHFFDDPQMHAMSEQFAREPLPIHAAVEWVRQQKEFLERSSPDYEAKLRAKIEAEIRASYENPSQSARPIPRSLASAPASGGSPPPGTGDPLFD
jgi:hypothetical protein